MDTKEEERTESMTMNKKFLLGALILFAGLLSGCGTSQTVDGTVVEKNYEPSHTSVGVGGKHTKIYYTPESYTLLVQTEIKSGTIEVKPDTYVRVKVGDHVRVTVNSVWGIMEVQP